MVIFIVIYSNIIIVISQNFTNTSEIIVWSYLCTSIDDADMEHSEASTPTFSGRQRVTVNFVLLHFNIMIF